MAVREYHLPTKVVFGVDSLNKLPSVVETYDPKDILLVTGRSAMKQAGVTDRIFDMLSDYNVALYDRSADSTPTEVNNGVSLALETEADVVIGLGGGSAMDNAKNIAILARNSGSVLQYIYKTEEISQEGLPLIEIPTTSGSSSEMTHWATIWEGPKKHSLSHKLMYAKVALLDPKLAVTMPRNITAATGMDSLSSAIEAYWSIYSNPMSDVHASRAIRLIYDNLEDACNNPEDLEYRENMMLGSLEAGRAFSQTKTTAPHAISYPMTGHFDVMHGHAVGLTIPSFLKYNFEVKSFDCNDDRGYEFVRERIMDLVQMMGATKPTGAANRMVDLMEKVGLPTRLRKAGVSDLEIIIKEGFHPDRVNNNPRKLTEDKLREILLEIN